MGKDVTFKVDYTVPSIGREFGSVFLGDKNVALMVVSDGWVKVREQGQQKGDASHFLAELLRLKEQAKQPGLGRWTMVEPNAQKIEEHRRKYEKLRKEREEKKIERERQRCHAEARVTMSKKECCCCFWSAATAENECCCCCC